MNTYMKYTANDARNDLYIHENVSSLISEIETKIKDATTKGYRRIFLMLESNHDKLNSAIGYAISPAYEYIVVRDIIIKDGVQVVRIFATNKVGKVYSFTVPLCKYVCRK